MTAEWKPKKGGSLTITTAPNGLIVTPEVSMGYVSVPLGVFNDLQDCADFIIEYYDTEDKPKQVDVGNGRRED